jgi:hypothetical protein
MSEPRKPGRPVRKPERFEVFESDEDSHLTPEQKTWKVVNLIPRGERSEPTVDASPALEVKLSKPAGEAETREDRFERMVAALETFELLLGGAGFAMLGRRPRTAGNEEVVVLYPRSPEGAAARLAKLADAINALGLGVARVA